MAWCDREKSKTAEPQSPETPRAKNTNSFIPFTISKGDAPASYPTTVSEFQKINEPLLEQKKGKARESVGLLNMCKTPRMEFCTKTNSKGLEVSVEFSSGKRRGHRNYRDFDTAKSMQTVVRSGTDTRQIWT